MKTNHTDTYPSCDRYNASTNGVIGLVAATAVALVAASSAKEQAAPVLSYEYNYLVGDGCLDNTLYDTSNASVVTKEDGQHAEISILPSDGTDPLTFSFSKNAAGRMVLTAEDTITVQILEEHNC